MGLTYPRVLYRERRKSPYGARYTADHWRRDIARPSPGSRGVDSRQNLALMPSMVVRTMVVRSALRTMQPRSWRRRRSGGNGKGGSLSLC